ncbi:hypothetical protein B0H16DRAFT_1791924 [Mycena metata]|uniref:Uncharacterized protein n=1 Tax=Mycena metata TaxID=1033252 RepID=A0AAD7HHW7_9AGAR|nr:hypothetical protein B0H16DRAFT_1791924 [Mycena metata]
MYISTPFTSFSLGQLLTKKKWPARWTDIRSGTRASHRPLLLPLVTTFPLHSLTPSILASRHPAPASTLRVIHPTYTPPLSSNGLGALQLALHLPAVRTVACSPRPVDRPSAPFPASLSSPRNAAPAHFNNRCPSPDSEDKQAFPPRRPLPELFPPRLALPFMCRLPTIALPATYPSSPSCLSATVLRLTCAASSSHSSRRFALLNACLPSVSDLAPPHFKLRISSSSSKSSTASISATSTSRSSVSLPRTDTPSAPVGRSTSLTRVTLASTSGPPPPALPLFLRSAAALYLQIPVTI